jgi:hypothetical protein
MTRALLGLFTRLAHARPSGRYGVRILPNGRKIDEMGLFPAIRGRTGAGDRPLTLFIGSCIWRNAIG